MVHEVEFKKIPQSIRLQGAKFEKNMRDFKVLLQRLIDSETKSNSILGFCRELYDFKEAKFRYDNAPSKAVKRARLADYDRQYEYIKDWLRVFHLEDKYIPEDFLDD